MRDKTPVVFISYTWEMKENPGHKEWVRKLADDLIHVYGVDVRLDQYEIKAGRPLTNFMERSVEFADKVLSICTPTYKKKALTADGGVGYEHQLITSKLFQIQADNTKFIPVLRLGKVGDSIPGYLEGLDYHKMVDDGLYQTNLQDLAQSLWDYSEIVKPELGPKPNFKTLGSADPIQERLVNSQKRQEIANRKLAFLRSSEAKRLAEQSFKVLLDKLEAAVIRYEAVGLRFMFQRGREHGLLQTGVKKGVAFHWTGNYTSILSEAKLWIRRVSGTPYMENGEVRWGDPSTKILNDVRLSFDVDDNLKPIWRDNDKEYSAETICKNEMAWAFDEWEKHQQALQERNSKLY